MNMISKSSKMLQNPGKWQADFEVVYMFEVPLERLKLFLPDTLAPREIRPGVGLVSIGTISFTTANPIAESCLELTFSIIVQSDLSLLGNHIPQGTYFPIQITSNSSAFLQYANSVDNIPIYQPKNIKISIDYATYSMVCVDEEGPIAELSIPMIPNIANFDERTFGAQIFTVKDEALYCASFTWSGKIFETQVSDMGKKCKIYSEHPFYKGLKIDNPIRDSHMLLMSPTGDLHTQTFYKPVVVKKL